MIIADPLRVALQELVRELRPHGITLIVGGGYGLVLRARYLRSTTARTLRPVPIVRGTEDIDCFLRSEIITDRHRTEAIRDVLDRLGYEPAMKNLQFVRSIDYEGQERTIKVDLLAAPVSPERGRMVKADATRIRAREYSGLHARVTPEAFPIEEALLTIDVSDDGSGLLVHLPHPFSFLLLKLHALHDRLAATHPAEGKYHALDMFTIWSMITENEWVESERLRARFAGHPVMSGTREILEQLFAHADSPGVVALRTQANQQRVAISDEDIDAFRLDLRALLEAPG